MRSQFDLTAPLASLFASTPSSTTGYFSLGASLRESAAAIERGRAMLGKRAKELASEIGARRGGELMLLAHSLRLVIAIIWLVLGFKLDRDVLVALNAGASMVGDMPLWTAEALSRVFLALAAFGIAAGLVGGLLVRGSGRGDNSALRRVSARLGSEAAEIARKFDASLDKLRAQMDHRPPASGDAVEDLSRMHLVALEATSFFHDIEFLTESDRAEAERRFRAYLREHSGQGAPASIFDLLLPFVAGGFFGLIVGYMNWAPVVEAPVVVDPYAFPAWSILASVGLALLYAAAGRVIDLLGGALSLGVAAEARGEALDSLRAAFVAGDAPRIDDVIRRIEDALAVYKARLAAGAKHDSQHAAASEPAWARAPDAPRFVEQAFLAAPPAFRVDSQALSRKIFSAKAAQNAAPKQSAEGEEPPPWLKE